MDGKTCESCKLFVKHYIRMGSRFCEVPFGHCTRPRIKSRKKDEKACDNYIAR